MTKLIKASPLAESIKKWTQGVNQYITPIQGLTFNNWKNPTEPTSYTLAPSICLIAQGKKKVILGEDSFHYDSETFIISSLDLPIVAQIIEASEKKPYLGITLNIDLEEISLLMVDKNLAFAQSKNSRGMGVGHMSASLLNAFERLLKLLDTPDDIPIMAPIIKKEIYYRLLISDQGARLRQIASIGNQGNQVAKAINWLKNNFEKPLQIKDLSESVAMSSSTFHHHFRLLTAMTPIQYQKRLRLNEARRLMLTENMDAANAAFQVGYESPSQFSREYSRFFGDSPIRDIKKLKHA